MLAFPGTRVFAERCAAACVAGTVAVGQRLGITAVPAFPLTDASGQTVRLADFRGKVVLLNFWATWCPPCKTEIPWFVEFQSKYEAAGLVVLGISMDEEGWAVWSHSGIVDRAELNGRLRAMFIDGSRP